nr:TPA_asm: m167.5 sORF [Murid betaherpesvirus 1]DBA08148.1 TPA_asm: m167.5 sORF [Murid betaherpesvirus 1]
MPLNPHRQPSAGPIGRRPSVFRVIHLALRSLTCPDLFPRNLDRSMTPAPE